MQGYGITDIGKVRRQNQDAFWLSPGGGEPFAAAVCDGMGGAKAGNVASQLCVAVFKTELARMLGEGRRDYDAMLVELINEANSSVYELSLSSANFQGMGTTMVAAIIDGGSATVVNVGDSRAYLISESGVKRITRDHSLVQSMVDRGELSPEEARVHPSRNYITRAVGTMETVDGDIYEVAFSEGDVLLLATDGLTNLVTDEELRFCAAGGKAPESVCRELLELALSRGAPDNVTVCVMSYEGR